MRSLCFRPQLRVTDELRIAIDPRFLLLQARLHLRHVPNRDRVYSDDGM